MRKKGNALEDAVRTLESIILSDAPGLAEVDLRVEPKKTMLVDGVRHEIDLYVSSTPAAGYGSVFIFECKNVKRPVSKNDIIVFSEKIAVTAAQRGFFIATKFSKDARAQAGKDPRMVLHVATELEMNRAETPYRFQIVQTKVHSPAIMLGTRSPELISPDVRSAQVILDGTPIGFFEYIRDWSNEIASTRVKLFRSSDASAGATTLDAAAHRVFERERLVVNGSKVSYALLSCRVDVTLVRPAIISHFDVEARGRCLLFEAVTIGGGEVQLGLVGRAPTVRGEKAP